MRNLLAALLFSTAVLACTKTADPTPAPAVADPAPAPSAAPIAADPTPAPAPAPAPTPAPAPVAAAEPAPDLVEVEAAPGVQVVADYDAPVFFHSGQYWRYNDGAWYSSSVYTGGWTHNASPPSVIVHLDRPERFVHYKPHGYVVHNRPAPQREWHPDVHAEVHANPHAEVHVEAPRVEVRAPRVEVPRVEVHVPNVEVRVPSVDVHAGIHVEQKPVPRDRH